MTFFLATPDIYSEAKRQWNLKINADLTKDASEWHVINESSVGATCVNSSKLQISKGNGNKDATLRRHVQNPESSPEYYNWKNWTLAISV